MNNTLDRNNVEDIVGLSPMQLGILYHYLSQPESHCYVAQLSLSMDGDLDIPIFQQACNIVTKNNEMLRTIYRWEGLTNPVQIVLKDYQIPIVRYDYKDQSDVEESLDKIKKRIWSEKIDISKHPVVIVLYVVNQKRVELIIQWHHILYDGWSNGLLIRELFTTYEDLKRGNVIQIQRKRKYRDFVKWCKAQDEEQQTTFWKNYLKGFIAKAPLPTSPVFVQDQTREFSSYDFELPTDLLTKLDTFFKEQDSTMAELVYTVWAILLCKLTGASDVVFGITVSGRNAELGHIDNMIGLFINTLPLRVKLNEGSRVNEIITHIAELKRNWMKWENTSLSKIRACCELNPNETLFDSVVVVENYPLNMNPWLRNKEAELSIQSYEMKEITEFPLLLGVFLPHTNRLTIQYDSAKYTEETIRLVSDYVIQILRKITSKPNTLLSEIELLLDEEKEEMLKEAQELIGFIDFDFSF
ncbi:hypothetical protein GC096_04290 [Paenibacillus sp. LMG 31461]|uniref:Condensation domain-containing protein n=1 Tax=Paenibacillus plantarum TaxID=2654975 RepID=A0ABX1X5B1_9BACL|nr:condensation domain-containing protein [Paenibacillus plantarum]NOU63263.1 hypothetical protein [Paenibacillus plantarum]